MEESIGDIRNLKKAKNNFTIAHNPKVPGSSPGSATKEIILTVSTTVGIFLCSENGCDNALK